jgi:predicted DNA-binding WGR domain protein
MKSSTVDMDFNFLKKVQKIHQDGRSEIEKLEQRGKARTSRRKLVLAKRKRGLVKARERGCDVEKVPEWMERSERNKTIWDPK